VLFFTMIVVNIFVLAYLVYKKGEWKKLLLSQFNILALFFVAFSLYFMLFYFIDVKVQVSNMQSLMSSSFKRGMFCFLPYALFYSATNYSSAWLFGKIEKFRTVAS